MDPERWKRMDEIFNAVLDREPSVRATFLAEVCEGDYSLRIELERLIACHEKESNLFDRPPSDLAAALLAKEDAYLETISHYRILKKIGRGGMGEVYLAEDTRLNRKVALKLLPPEFTKDKERIRRFEKEARAVSALNHPNILTIHDIGKTESSSFIATEYIDGESLRQRIRASKVPLKEVLTIVIQVAEALDAAHQAGVIHRDIKPENIMLRKDGYVKVLDFGLAKLTEPDTEASDVSDLETDTRTQTGIVIGTFRYMSPEQARGLNVDTRTDIFSLGGVLYELISGRAPFDGATSGDVIVAILGKNPTPLRSYAEVPEELEWIVRKALAKDVDERYQNVRDLIADLKRIRKRLDVEEELKSSDPSTSARDAIARPSIGVKQIAFVSVILIALAGLILLFMQRDKEKTSTQEKPFSRIKLTQLTSSGSAWSAAISPDGKYVSYLQESEPQQSGLYLRQLSSDTEILLLKLPSGTNFWGPPAFSHDSEYIYYETWQPSKSKIGSLYQIPVLGGISQKLIEDLEMFTVSPDRKRFAFIRKVRDEEWLMTAHVDGRNQRKISSHKRPNNYQDIAWSPDGRIIAAIVGGGQAIVNGDLKKQIVKIDLDDGSQQPIYNKSLGMEASNDLEWLPNGRGLLLTDVIQGKGQVCLLSYPEGKLTSITNDFNDYGGVSVTKDFKSLVTTQWGFYSSIWVASSPKPDIVTQITTGSSGEDGNTGLSWTPDGKILYRSRLPSGDFQICLVNADGTNRHQITTGPPIKHWPIASPDGRSIIYMSEEDENIFRIWHMDVDGSNSKPLVNRKHVKFPRYSPDGKWIIFCTFGQEKEDLIKLRLDDQKEITLATHPEIYGGAVSPDGDQIAYLCNDGQREVWNIISSENGTLAKSFPLQGKNVITNGRIHWIPDGRGLSYLAHSLNASNIFIQPTDGSPPRQYTNFTADLIGNYCWSMDGKQIAYSRGKQPNFNIVLIQSLP